ncbi:MAG: CopG family ribbon-helix-helix protein [Planctomycetota bacterium]
MSTLTVRVPDDLKRDLVRLSKQRGLSAGDLVRESLQRYLAVSRFRALREEVVPAAEAAGFLTDEDVFKAIS